LISKRVTQIGGVFLLGAFALLTYIGLYDANLQTLQLHWYINWVLAAASLVAAALLLAFPRKTFAVVLGGIIWPLLFVGSLAVDVYTRLCLGGNQANCWPTKTDAFQYLILNNPNVAGGYGWQLWQGTMPTILVLMFLTFVISIVTLYSLRTSSSAKIPGAVSTPGAQAKIK
jgi:hypothetical protein